MDQEDVFRGTNELCCYHNKYGSVRPVLLGQYLCSTILWGWGLVREKELAWLNWLSERFEDYAASFLEVNRLRFFYKFFYLFSNPISYFTMKDTQRTRLSWKVLEPLLSLQRAWIPYVRERIAVRE